MCQLQSFSSILQSIGVPTRVINEVEWKSNNAITTDAKSVDEGVGKTAYLSMLKSVLADVMTAKDATKIREPFVGKPYTIMIIGQNQSGKSSIAAKLAYCLHSQKISKKVLIVPSDLSPSSASSQQLKLLLADIVSSSSDIDIFKSVVDLNSTRDIYESAKQAAVVGEFDTLILDNSIDVSAEFASRDLQELKTLVEADETLLVLDVAAGFPAASFAAM